MAISAKERVFSTPEILEAILLFLPLTDLLIHAQRINRHFHATITASPQLQQALFFRASPRNFAFPTKDPGPDTILGFVPFLPDLAIAHDLLSLAKTQYVMNPLLSYHLPTWFKLDSLGPAGLDQFEMDTEYEIKDALSTDSDRYKRAFKRNQPPSRDPSPERVQRTEAFTRAKASWRRMLVLQPPVLQLRIKQTGHAMGGSHTATGHVDLDAEGAQADPDAGSGVRMGVVYDLTHQWLHYMRIVSCFGVRWDCLLGPVTRKGLKGGTNGISEQDCITLVLIYTRQCTGEEGERNRHLKSKAYRPREVIMFEDVAGEEEPYRSLLNF